MHKTRMQSYIKSKRDIPVGVSLDLDEVRTSYLSAN